MLFVAEGQVNVLQGLVELLDGGRTDDGDGRESGNATDPPDRCLSRSGTDLFGNRLDEPPFEALFLVALKTGMRQGELLALSWGDVDLSDAVIRVRRSITDGHLSTPKNHERRDVDLTTDVVEQLGGWWGECGRPGDDCLVFPGETRSGYPVASTILRRGLYPTMQRAGIPREGSTGEKRTFHSFRHTFAKRALDNGAQITWLSRHLGHSTLKVTSDVYGHWERAERKRQAQLLEGVFGV